MLGHGKRSPLCEFSPGYPAIDPHLVSRIKVAYRAYQADTEDLGN